VKVQTVTEQIAQATGVAAPRVAPPRNTAVDAYRGFVMLLMMAEVLRLSQVARNFPGNWFWQFLSFNQSHVEWAGCSLHDTIQPSFSFLVGVALPYSIASRLAKGASFGKMLLHTVWRSLLLIALGIFLRSQRGPITYFTFEDTLSQIGLGYTFLFLLGFVKPRWQWTALAAILGGYWLAWALYPVPGPGFDWATVGVPADLAHKWSGFAAHWNKNANLGNAFDVWFLNLFPRTRPFAYNGGGYLTLSFIPTLGTMLLGLIAGRWLRAVAPRIPFKKILIAAAVCLVSSLILHFAGICPIVKKIWTPAWTLFSGALCFLYLAVFCWVIEEKKYKKWAFPLIVIGMNSIAAYFIADYFGRQVLDAFRIHLGEAPFRVFGENLLILTRGAVQLTVYWLVLLWMYRRKIFLRV
jgi:heparan-alpha-glucosaminide N-acetyltransferase